MAPLTGQPCTNRTSGPVPTRRYATSPSPTSRYRDGGRRKRSEASSGVMSPPRECSDRYIGA
ncbi:MAG: hypothetical protein AVDCRST_MAG24-755 [uncultured Nocardioidaceae bacterium]|uniref:Uncharacterized protein n=1 Tax=uncultured Nocardioidaceae bacterium TaxID=253824 RepID=A0A6J4LCM6_9ACTN|nr:MAG: hypothetical protein AVDCRST_MAG24-755 [uncultured Nocardioidaceae bacterium]